MVFWVLHKQSQVVLVDAEEDPRAPPFAWISRISRSGHQVNQSRA